MNESILAALLSRYCNYYNNTLFELAERYQSLALLYNYWQTARHPAIPSQLQEALSLAWTKAQYAAMEKQLADHEITCCLATNPSYPRLLQEINDKPYVLYTQGEITYLNHPLMVSIVGARRMTPYGKQALHYFIPPLASANVCIVSGMAFGIDGEAHRVALRHALPTIAVLAGGLDDYYPQTHYQLGESIREQGCIVSEYPPGVPAMKHRFLERNRIVAGLSPATIIIEGQEYSGSLVTARHALRYGRDVAALPGNIFTPQTQAPHILLRDGAWPLLKKEDIFGFLGLPVPKESIQTHQDYGPLYGQLKQESASIDWLVEKLKLSPSDISSQLTKLELDGLIRCTATGIWQVIEA